MKVGYWVVWVVTLTGCGASSTADHAAAGAASQRLPADARLADLYTHACRNCHAAAASGAPLAGDRTAWRDRWSKGPDVLLRNTLQGFKGMPAGGQCVRCTVPDLEALIRFMSDAEGQ